MHGIVVHSSGEPASGITVATGAVVTTTDAEGRFDLPRQDREGGFVVLSRPTGFTASPWWFRVPTEPADATAAIEDAADAAGAPTAPEFRFVLTPEEQPLPYEFVHLTDTHMSLPKGPDDDADALDFGLYREGSLPDQITGFLGRLSELAPNARSIMITGDLVDHGLAAEYEAYVAALAESPVPVHVIPGNHDHMNGTHGSTVSRNNYLTNTGTPEVYERFLGPRWYSFDVAGLHVVALDWHTHELGLDHEVQNEWVRADLAQLPEGSPWILLFHDQPAASIVSELPWQPKAAFSGHWHTSRVVEVDGTLHVNSPTSFFASLDYTPPAFRKVTWDGARITMVTQTLVDPSTTGLVAGALGDVTTSTFAASSHVSDDASVLWRAELAAAGHRQRVSVALAGEHGAERGAEQGAEAAQSADAARGTEAAQGVVFAGGQIEDRAAGSVEAIDLATGALLWRTPTASAVKTTPVPAGGLVIAAEVSGDLTALDAETGDVVWRVPSSDPLRRFAWGSPTVADGRVFLGDQSDVRAVDIATGEVLWRRTDLSPHHNLVNHSAPLIVGDLLVMGFWPTPKHPIGLDVRTGESVWTLGDGDRSADFFELKQLLIMGTATFDEQTDSVVMPAFGNTTRVDRATGRTVWTAAHEGGFSPTSPIVTDAGYVVTVTGRGIRMLDRETGETIWDAPVTGDAPFPMASYTKTPHPVIAPPVLVGEHLLLPGLDGVIRRFDLDGTLIGQTQLGSSIAAGLVHAGDRLIAVGVDGNVIALGLDVAGSLA